METFSIDTAADGLVTEHNEAGVLYKYNGKTLELQGEQDCGDVYVGDELVGEYGRDDDGLCCVTVELAGNVHYWELDTEEDYAAFARAVLA